MSEATGRPRLWDGSETSYWRCVQNIRHGVGIDSDYDLLAEVLLLALRDLESEHHSGPSPSDARESSS